MATSLPVSFVFGAMPPNFIGNPQQMGDAFAARLSLVTSAQFALFVTGSTAPTSDVGPWWKDGNTWYYWDALSGSYLPQILEQSSLGYWIGPVAPDPAVYQFWIETTVGGSPLALKVYFGGSWVDVYTAILANYQTIAAFNTAIANYSTTTQMNAAIAAAIAALPEANAYPVRAEPSVNQSVVVDANRYKINFGTEDFDPENVFSAVTSQYTAPIDGIYLCTAELQVDNNTATAAGMEMQIDIIKNGATLVAGAGTSVASPPGGRWYPQTTALVNLVAGDTLEVTLSCNDGVLAGLVAVATGSSVNINLIHAL